MVTHNIMNKMATTIPTIPSTDNVDAAMLVDDRILEDAVYKLK